MSNKITSKLAFKKPSGESRLDESIKKEIVKEEVLRLNFDIPKDLAINLKIKAAKEGKTMREVVIEALNLLLNK